MKEQEERSLAFEKSLKALEDNIDESLQSHRQQDIQY